MLRQRLLSECLRWLAGCAGAGVVLAGGGRLAAAESDFQGSHHILAYDDEPFLYSKSEPDDPVARLQRRLKSGEIRLEYEPKHGYLRSFLKALDIPISSQVLVFSKTSLHRDLISPQNPRAIFFNDDVYVGWVRWAPVLEISSADPRKGGMFYVLPQNETKEPQVVRNLTCVECHVSRFSMGVPGHLVRSVRTDESGHTGDITGGVRVSHDTPYPERRGGWYVTARRGAPSDLANLIGAAAFARHEQESVAGGEGSLTNLSAFFDAGIYPQPHSDIVAIMLLEHQVHMHNFLTRLNYEATMRLRQYGHIRYVHKVAESFLKYMLFTEEAPLKGPIEGTSTFARDFQQRGPRDRQGRSLRELDLQTRLLKYPCSYLVYSEAFDGLPREMKDYLYRRLWEILTNQDNSGEFETMRSSTRRAILEILVETKPDLPDYWKTETAKNSP